MTRVIIEFLWENGADELLQGLLSPQEAEAVCEKCALAVLESDGFPVDCAICVQFTDGGGIRDVNSRMRGIDAETDVLSFPAISLNPDEKSKFKPKKSQIDVETGAVLLGDMVISIERALEQAREFGHSAEREIGYLCAHSVAHLLGYDHMNAEDKAAMRSLEERAMARANLPR